MPTDPLTGSRYPVASDAPAIWTMIQDAVTDLSENTVAGPFASTAARDAAYAQWVNDGHTMRAGLVCAVSGSGLHYYDGAGWKGLNGPIAVSSSSTQFNSSGASEQRVTGTITMSTNLALRSGRMYRVEFKGRAWAGTVNEQVTLRIRVGTNTTITTSNTAVASHQSFTMPTGSNSAADAADVKFDGAFAVQANGTYGVALFGLVSAGTFAVNSDDRDRYEMILTDCGPAVAGLITVT